MGKCTAHLYEHHNYGGRRWNFNKTYKNVESGGLGRNWTSSYKLSGNCDNTVVMACRHDQWHSHGEDCFYMQKGRDNPTMHHRRGYWDNNWGDEIDSIVFQNVPNKPTNKNQFQYDMETQRYTPASPGDTYCGGCRLWPQVKHRTDPKKIDGHHRVWLDPDGDKVWHDSTNGFKNPCPGASEKYFTSGQGKGVRCIYKNDENAMKALHRRKGDHRKIGAMYDAAVLWFCGNAENMMKSPDGSKKCREIGNSNDLSRAYCKVGSRIKPKRIGGDDACDKRQINNDSLWEELATNFCKANKNDAWCACYNAASGVCDKDKTAAGCTKVMAEHDAIIKSLPSSQVGTQALKALNARKNCRAGVCNGTVFKPSQMNDCDLNIEMCVQEVNVGGHVVDTGITMKCEKGDVTKGGGKGTVERNETREQQLKRLREENPDSSEKEIQQMAKLEEKGWSKRKKMLIYGGGFAGLSVSSLCCCLLVILLMFM